MSKALSIALIVALACPCASSRRAEAAEPANTLQEMFSELRGCLNHVSMEKGAEVTIQFSLNRRGGLIGKPRITYAHWVGDDDSRKKTAASIAEGLDHCLPLPITDKLGGAIAGRPMAFRLRAAEGKEENV